MSVQATPERPRSEIPSLGARVAVELAERALVPDALIRLGIRRMLRAFLEEMKGGGRSEEQVARFAAELRRGPIAVSTDAANSQHYMVPARFFDLALGRLKKYSCCLWPEGVTTLDEAEEEMLRVTCERAGIEDGMKLLDLGCGWGSFSLYAASRFPGCEILAVSNSSEQRLDIEARAREMGLDNVRAVTGDVVSWKTDERFDRVVSVEMFEHMKNYRALLGKIRPWLAPGGALFVHVFCHRRYAYSFDEQADGWMGSEFFTGGLMPSEDLFGHFEDDLVVANRWEVSGVDYAKTLRAWLDELDGRRDEALAIMRETYGREEAGRRLQKWRLFFIACEESFAYDGGREWKVGHYLFTPR